MSYRPMSCFSLSQENDKNEGSFATQGGGALLRWQTSRHHYLTDTHTYPPPLTPSKKHNGLIRQEKCAVPSDAVPVCVKTITDIQATRQLGVRHADV